MAIISSCVQTFIDLNEISIGDIPPISPSNNQLWLCTKDNGTFLNNMLYKYNSSIDKWEISNDYTDEILEAIKDLNVTSRNLLSDTAISKDLVCTGIVNQCGAKYGLVKTVDYTKHLKNNKLTYAFDWEYIGDNPNGTFVAQTAGPQWTQISKTITISADNYWGTCTDTITFTSENPFTEIGIRADNVVGTIKITHPRLMFGEKDLGWSQAPEDLEEKFTTIFNRTDKGIYMEHTGAGTTGLIDVNNKAIKISAPSLFLEGYTTINEHFKVLPTGDIEGTNAKFNGTITSGGTISGTAISGGTVIGSTIQNAVDNPTFKVTPTGAMTASNATIKGTISGSIISGETFTSANNKFKVLGNGTLEATEANITGAISAGSTITGSTVIGSTIQNAATNPTFIVSNTGSIKGAAIVGSSFQNAETNPTFKVDTSGRVDASNMNITGGSLNVGSNFSVSNTGILTAKSANFTGSVNAGSTITGSVIQNATSNPTFKIDASGNITGGSININNAFNVNSSGKLVATGAEISGKVNITSGSVPDSVLSSTITQGATNGTNANSKIDNLDMGTRNLLKCTSSKYRTYDMGTWFVFSYEYTLEELGLKVGDNIVYSSYIKLGNVANMVACRINFVKSDDTYVIRTGNPININSEGVSVMNWTIPEGTVRMRIGYNRNDSNGTGSNYNFEAKEEILVKGNKIGSWNPAPSDSDKYGTNLYVIKNSLEGYLQSGAVDLGPINNIRQEHTSEYISVFSGEKYVFQMWTTLVGAETSWMAYQFYNSNKELLGNRITVTSSTLLPNGKSYNKIDIDVPTNAKFIRVSARFFNDGQLKLEKGMNPSDWSLAQEDAGTKIISAENTLKDSSNWTNAYNRVKEWAYGAVNGSTTINGGLLQTNTIQAEKMAIGDFTNICQIDENRNPVIISKILNTATTEVITYTDNKKYFKFGHATSPGYYGLILINDMQILKVGDVFRFNCTGFSTSSSIRLTIRATYTDGTYTDLGANTITFTSTASSINSIIKITNDINATKVIKDITCLIYNNNSIGLTYLRSISINRMSTGELIVDGSITSNMIHTDGLDANTIKTGTLDATRIGANTITAQHLAIGDFTNYCPVTPDNCSTYGYTKVVDGNNSWIQLPVTRDVGLCKNHYATYTGNVAGTYYIEFEVSSNAQGELTNGKGDIGYMFLGLGAYCKTKDGANAWFVMSKIKSDSTSSIQKTSGYIVIPDNIASFGVAFQHSGWSKFSGTTKIRNIKFNKMMSGELVVDGAITADKIAANSVTADKITIGDFTNYCTQPFNYTMMNGQPAYYMGVQSTQGYTVSSNITQLKGGEQFNISGQIYAPPGNGGQTNFNLYFYWVDNANHILSNSVVIQAAPQGTTKELNLMINIPARPASAIYGYFRATCGNAAYNLYWINPTIRLMMSGELIVDGAITANKITIGDGVAGSGNLAAGLTTTGATSSAISTDGQKAIGTPYISFGSGSGNNNSPERDYIQLDLGSTKILSESRVYFFSADNRYYFYKIKYSSDGTNWYYAVGKTSNDGWMTSSQTITMTNGFENPTINTFSPAISARYVRLYSNGNTVNGGNHIYEWELYSQSTTQISGNQITTGKLTASSGGSYLDLNNGSMMLGNTSNTNYLQWTGSSLNIKADSLSLKTGGTVATLEDVNGLQLKFSQNENQNLLYNGDFKNGFTNWTNSGSNTIINTASCPTNMNSIRMIGQLGITKQVYQELRDINYAGQLFLGFWAYVSSTGVMGTTNALLAAQLMLEYTDGTKVYPLVQLYSKFDTWERRTLILTPPAGKRIKNAFLGIYNRDTTKEAYVTDVIVSKSGIEMPFSQNPNEMYDGIIDLNKTGITVTASNANTKTVMDTNGFFLKKLDGTNLFKVDSTGLEMIGKVTATSGQIAGFNINNNSLWGGNLGLAGPTETQTQIAIWSGNTIPERAPLKIYHSGEFISDGEYYSGGPKTKVSIKNGQINLSDSTGNAINLAPTGVGGQFTVDGHLSCMGGINAQELQLDTSLTVNGTSTFNGDAYITGKMKSDTTFIKATNGDTTRDFSVGNFGGDDIYGNTQGVAYLGNCLIIYGSYSFTGLVANEVKTATIKFRVNFAMSPYISLTGNTSVPHIIDMGASAVSSTQFNLNFRRTNTTDTTIFWMAFGQRG